MFFEASASNLRFSTLRVGVSGEREISELRSPNSLSPNVPQSLLGDALNPNKSDIYLAGLRQYIPDLRPGLCCAQAYDSYGWNSNIEHCDMFCKTVPRAKFANA